ncbi:MAG: hypothetical protein JWP75_1024 [Frondihabitans sp.]|nr:hypothetical protein [Frondihabitans sp.]
MVTAVMDDSEHPISRAIATPVEGVAVVDSDETEVTDTASITIPTADILADPEAVAELVAAHSTASDDEHGYPVAPERGSLDDDDLVPLVDRHTNDTATIDLIGILQAQMQLRTREAERFAAWEEHMRQIGTAEALGEVERTRLHFTGVIPVQRPASMVTTLSPAPASAASSGELATVDAETVVAAPVIGAGTAPTADEVPAVASAVHERTLDEEILEHDEPVTSVTSAPTGEARLSPSPSRRILVPVLSVAAGLVVIAAVVLTAVGSTIVGAAALSALGVVAAAWIGIVLARVALRPRGSRVSAPVTTRTAWVLVAGLVVGTVLGEGLVRTSVAAFSWQGYLLRLVDVQGFHAELSVVAAIVGALVVAFVIVVLGDRSPEATASAN